MHVPKCRYSICGTVPHIFRYVLYEVCGTVHVPVPVFALNGVRYQYCTCTGYRYVLYTEYMSRCQHVPAIDGSRQGSAVCRMLKDLLPSLVS
jgi:hypothetical protein